jgi:hypothetical protein
MTAVERAAAVLAAGADVGFTYDEMAQNLADAGLLVTDEWNADHEKWRQHSVMLNSVAWALSDLLGDIPEGAESHEGPEDPMELVDRIRAQLVTDEIQAVLDAAKTWRKWMGDGWTDSPLAAAVDAYLTSRVVSS